MVNVKPKHGMDPGRPRLCNIHQDLTQLSSISTPPKTSPFQRVDRRTVVPRSISLCKTFLSVSPSNVLFLSVSPHMLGWCRCVHPSICHQPVSCLTGNVEPPSPMTWTQAQGDARLALLFKHLDLNCLSKCNYWCLRSLPEVP